MTDEHIWQHLLVWSGRWGNNGSGLSANLFAKFLGVKPERVIKVFNAHKSCPWYCGGTMAIMWRANESDGVCRRGHGNGPSGKPLNHKEAIALSLEQAKLGAGSVEDDALMKDVRDFQDDLNIKKIPKEEFSNAKCVHCIKGKIQGRPRSVKCACGCGAVFQEYD